MNYAHFFIAAALSLLLQQAHAQSQSSDAEVGQAIQLILEGKQVEAEALLRLHSEKGNLQATAMLGSLLTKRGKNTEAIQILEPAAMKGNAEAQWQLSQTYALASPPNFEKSQIWLRRSAEAGHAKAKIILEDQTELRPDAEGRVSTQALLVSIRSLIAAKAATFTEQTFKCYGASRSELVAVFNQALAQCFEALPANQKDRVLPTQAIAQSLAACANKALFAHAGKTPAELAACLPSK